MGSRLRRMIRDGAPPSWTPLMRLVAYEIADAAYDPQQSGESKPWSLPLEGFWTPRGKWIDGLAERTGMSTRAISRALTELSRAGYEMRVPVGKDELGRPVFAHHGHAIEFTVPPLAPWREVAEFGDLPDDEENPF